jgi:hypothetical protein
MREGEGLEKDLEPAKTPGASRLKVYMAYDGEVGSSEGACLVFAHTVMEAKQTALPILSNWGCEFLDARVKWMKEGDHLFAEANQEKLAQGIPHAIESPKSCRHCDLWGEYIYLDGVCENCRDDYDEEQEAAQAAPERSSAEGPTSNPHPTSHPLPPNLETP